MYIRYQIQLLLILYLYIYTPLARHRHHCHRACEEAAARAAFPPESPPPPPPPESPPPPGPLALSPAVRACLDKWKVEFKAGIAALTFWRDSQDAPIAGGGIAKHMSLIELAEPACEYGVHGSRVVFITWSDVVAREGRIVHLEHVSANTARFVYSTPSFHATRSFASEKAILPTFGITLGKAPSKRMRQEVPPHVHRLWRMWSTSVLAQTIAEDTSLLECDVCAISDEQSHLCSICLCAWHGPCCKKLLALEEAKREVQELYNSIALCI